MILLDRWTEIVNYLRNRKFVQVAYFVTWTKLYAIIELKNYGKRRYS